MGRPDFNRARWWTALLAALAIGLTACGSTNAGVTAREANAATSVEPQTSASTPTETLETVETSVPATDPVPTEPATTEPATTPPTEAPTTTTTPGVASGWMHVDAFPEQVFPPYFESNWIGVPSPEITSPLADGFYVATVTTAWSSDRPATLDIVLQQLVPCTELPPDYCFSSGEPYQPNELGLASGLFEMTIPLDASIGVGLTGFDCVSDNAFGNGADLATLLTNFYTAYTATITPALVDGTDIGAQLNASPAQGFSGMGGSCGADGFSVVFHDGDAPPLLLQTLSYPGIDANGNTGRVPLTPTDVVRLNAVQVVDGVMTFYFYAGFYS